MAFGSVLNAVKPVGANFSRIIEWPCSMMILYHSKLNFSISYVPTTLKYVLSDSSYLTLLPSGFFFFFL